MEVGTVTAVIAGLLSVIALLLIVIRWVMDSKKPVNGNGTKQSRECWEQHQTVLSELKLLKQDVGAVQKTLDDRAIVFQKVQERLDDINITVLRGWDGVDRRK